MAWRQLLSQANPAPNREIPEPEHVAGEEYNQPYRGMEDHGVTPPYKATAVPNYDDEREGYLPTPPEKEEEPIPVRVVQEFSKELKKFRVYTTTVATGTAVNLCGRNEARSAIHIKNMAASGFIWISHSLSLCNDTFGYAIASRGEIVINTENPVYCYAATADSQVCVMEEYTVSE